MTLWAIVAWWLGVQTPQPPVIHSQPAYYQEMAEITETYQLRTPIPVAIETTDHSQLKGQYSGDWKFIDYIFMKESSWRLGAVNAHGCIGLGQSCPNGSGLANQCPDWQHNIDCQVSHFDQYAKRRYGSWAAAYNFHKRNNWW